MNETSVVAATGESNGSAGHCKERIVAAAANIRPGMKFRSSLTNDDGAGTDEFASIRFDAKHFWFRISTVLGRAHSFLMCHDYVRAE
jgi:hypothetical protein